MKLSKLLLTMLLALCSFVQVLAVGAPDEVSGIVKDKNGEPVVGAVLVDVSGKASAVTNLNGEFSFNPNGNEISVSCLGYKTKTVFFLAGQTLTIVLDEDNTLLDDAVVVGYAVQSRANLTGAVSTVDVGKSLAGRSIPDIGRGLQGAAAGLSVTVPDAEVGSDAKIRIRGSVASIEGGSSPLILLDNVEIPSLQVVNTDDVESISILKDAASTSIYGAKAAFGVILITTKKGAKTDKINVSYNQ